MKFHTAYILVIIAFCGTLISCVEEQDFGQYDDIRVTPIVEGSILYVEAPESLINSAGDVDIISRDFNFDAFSSDIFAERVLDGTITYIVENTTSKEINILIELLNAEGGIIDRESISLFAESEVQRDVTYGNSQKNINIIKFTSSIRITATNEGDNISTSDLPDPKIILKSSGRFRLNIK